VSTAAQPSDKFNRLYGDASVFESFSEFHPISFRRVLPFQSQDAVIDQPDLLAAEEAQLTSPNDRTRADVVDAYARHGLLTHAEAINLRPAIDFYGADFFELMGLAYANAGRFKCALRWYRELIRDFEARPEVRSDEESVYASVGYCLYSLGLFEEAIAWTKACIGPRPIAAAVCEGLIGYEMEPVEGHLRVERAANRVRYTVLAPSTEPAGTVERLTDAMRAIAPFQDVYLHWLVTKGPPAETVVEGYPFKPELGGGTLPRHKMILIFATCSRADVLIESGHVVEARRLLEEAIMVEPDAEIVRDRLAALG
jgi:tetratricopeptide (TPR) repeat protein